MIWKEIGEEFKLQVANDHQLKLYDRRGTLFKTIYFLAFYKPLLFLDKCVGRAKGCVVTTTTISYFPSEKKTLFVNAFFVTKMSKNVFGKITLLAKIILLGAQQMRSLSFEKSLA